ncbi:unnamed protein product [Didymodactylos carnosus]|uniref:Uncharacterized protein n=1 Tax=Didymodactylos carnosus TaxID=1234261 RepID=A0A815VJL4_9BILA|nr:unnamed protein product [Didymodactylos carnosus]CAF1531281.1 unnamed protein product [Didymodactylos carnosus]CAF3761702.1 unnamed protein product [Didymodactylos carnosus]CAF4390651.1 unnamed protein product [Didymodactylos carnosus]
MLSTIITKFCSIQSCEQKIDVHCYHCENDMCGEHFFEHQQLLNFQNEPLLIDTLNELVDQTNRLSLSTNRMAAKVLGTEEITNDSDDFKKQIIKQKSKSNRKKKSFQTRKKATLKVKVLQDSSTNHFYNLRTRKTINKRTSLGSKGHNTALRLTDSDNSCTTILRSGSTRQGKKCNRKLPCPYHSYIFYE